MKGTARRLLQASVMVILGALVAALALLMAFQRHLIYYPRGYGGGVRDAVVAQGGVVLDFRTSSGAQTAFYIPPVGGKAPPQNLWVLFNGNAALALDWLPTALGYPGRQGTGFLLVDYPGYGYCEGKASPSTIAETTDAAFVALAGHLQEDPAALEKRTGTLGMSLGAAAATLFASRHHLRAVALMAPFRSTGDMAARMVGPIGRVLLLHRFDNAARLNEVSRQSPPPPVLIVHGGADEIIPINQSLSLAREHPTLITHKTVPMVSHNGIYGVMGEEVIPWMLKQDGWPGGS